MPETEFESAPTTAAVPSYGAPAYPSYPQPAQGPQPVQPMQAPAPYGAPVPGAVPAPPPSNAGWAAAAVVFFWPLAFAAFNYSASVYPKWALGDYQGAQHASDRTKQLGMIALGIAIGLTVLLVLFYFVVIIAAINAADSGY
ncbi:CD225/dispanin family protein [Rhodococcus sp. NPDC059234]|uniref:CD225/dispanin family protein n=1 Tax=Rhodococcus sp. NPDC059234 TaxID=3346781 RepID=UPI0036724C75